MDGGDPKFMCSAREVIAEHISDPLLDRDVDLPTDVVRQRSRERHGFRSVLHHVSRLLPGGLWTPVQRGAGHPEEFGATVPRTRWGTETA